MSTALRCFAFVDLAGYTALTEAHGDEGAADCVGRFYALAQAARAGDTRIVKRIGDAVMLASTDCACCVETVLELLAKTQTEPDFPDVRSGLACGPAVERDGDFFGVAVNLAARIAGHARAGEVLCDEAVATILARDPRVRVTPLGVVALKNVVQPVAVFSVRSVEEPVSTDPVDPVCRMRVRVPKVVIEHEGTKIAFCSDACAERFRASPEPYLRSQGRSPS